VFDDQYGAGIKGTPISGIPDWLANFGVEYDNKNLFIDNDSFSARLGGTYTGQQYTTCDIYNGANETGPLANLAQYDGKCSDAPAGSPSVPNSLKTQTGGNYGGLTVTDTNHRLSAFAVFNLLLSYTMPTPELPMVKHVKFDLNIQNLFDQRYYQYFYSQITPVAGAYVGNSFNNGLPGEPFAVTFTATARF
jgi:iron complex outermembrane receptor protein